MTTYDTIVNAMLPWVYAKLIETSGTVATDSSGNARHGTYYNGIALANAGTPIAGNTENAPTATSASSHFANVSLSGGFMAAAVAAGGISFSFWYKGSAGNWPTIGFLSGGQELQLIGNGTFSDLYQPYLSSPTTGQTICTENFVIPTLTDGNWHHVVCILNFAGPDWFMSVDNVPCAFWGGAVTTTLNPALLVEPTTPCGIFATSNGAATATQNKSGSISHLSIFARQLTVRERKYLFNAGTKLRDSFTRVPKVYAKSPGLWREIGALMRTNRVEAHIYGDSTSTTPGGNGQTSLSAFASMMRTITGTDSPASQWVGFNSGDGALGARTWPLGTSWTDVTTTSNNPPNVFTFQSVDATSPYALHFDVVGLCYGPADVSASVRGETLEPDTVTFDVIAQKKAGSGPLDVTVLGGNVPFGVAGETRFLVSAKQEMFTAAELTNADSSLLKKSLTFKTGGYQYLTFQLSYRTAAARVVCVRAYDPAKAGLSLSSFSSGGYQSGYFVASHDNCGAVLAAIGAPSFIMIDIGTNDEINGNTSATYKTNITAMIANLRTKYGVANLPCILLAHPIFLNTTAAYVVRGDEYAQALYEIAQADDAVAMLNVRLGLHQAGWNHAAMTYTSSAWATATSYVVGDVRSIALSAGETWFFKCLTNHTSSASIRPPNKSYWEQIAQWTLDGIHYSSVGGAIKGGMVAGMMGRLLSGNINSVWNANVWASNVIGRPD